MKKTTLFLIFFITFFSCENEEKPLIFSETNFASEEATIIDINIPKFDENSKVSKLINEGIEHFVARSINDYGDDFKIKSIEEALNTFSKENKAFNEEFPDVLQPWEVLVDGEVIYQSSEIVSIAINTYTNTGGAHGNNNIYFLNFNTLNGLVFKIEDLVVNNDSFHSLVKRHFRRVIKDVDNYEGFLFGDEFYLPATIGFNDDGVIILYQAFASAKSLNEIVEFTIPYEELNDHLKVH